MTGVSLLCVWHFFYDITCRGEEIVTAVGAAGEPGISSVTRTTKMSPTAISGIVGNHSKISSRAHSEIRLLLRRTKFHGGLPAAGAVQSVRLIIDRVAGGNAIRVIGRATSCTESFNLNVAMDYTKPSSKRCTAEGRTDDYLHGTVRHGPLNIVLLLSGVSSTRRSLLRAEGVPCMVISPINRISTSTLKINVSG